MTKIIRCTCVHFYQDEKYGKGRRVANKTKSLVGVQNLYRCTVCGQTKLPV